MVERERECVCEVGGNGKQHAVRETSDYSDRLKNQYSVFKVFNRPVFESYFSVGIFDFFNEGVFVVFVFLIFTHVFFLF